MKVINGSFGKKEEEDSPPLKEAIAEVLVEAGVQDETTGRFFMMVETDDRTCFVTNEPSPGECVLLLEYAKASVLAQAMMMRGTDDSGGAA